MKKLLCHLGTSPNGIRPQMVPKNVRPQMVRPQMVQMVQMVHNMSAEGNKSFAKKEVLSFYEVPLSAIKYGVNTFTVDATGAASTGRVLSAELALYTKK